MSHQCRYKTSPGAGVFNDVVNCHWLSGVCRLQCGPATASDVTYGNSVRTNYITVERTNEQKMDGYHLYVL